MLMRLGVMIMSDKFTFTVQIPLRSPSNKKEKRLEEIMEAQGEIAEKIAELMPSIPKYRWGNTRMDSVFHRWVDKYFPDNNGLRSHDANQVAYKVSENFKTYLTQGLKGNQPSYDPKDHSWIRFCNCNDSIKYEKNNGKWGVRLPLEPYNPKWFRAKIGSYQEKYLKKWLNDKAKLGDAELKKNNELYILNQTITFESEKPDYEPETYVGVDMGLDNIATVVVINEDEEVLETKFFSGKEVSHYRRKFNRLRSKLQAAGKTKKIEGLEDHKRRYYEQKNHEVSRKIIEIAQNYNNPIIVMENLKNITSSVKDQDNKKFKRNLSSWSHGELQGMIEYKTEKENIKTSHIPAQYTSKVCNKCGRVGQRPYKKNYSRFYCPICDYEVNADFNGAVNIAKKELGTFNKKEPQETNKSKTTVEEFT